MAYHISADLSDKRKTQLKAAINRVADRKAGLSTAETALGKLIRQTVLVDGVSQAELRRQTGLSQSVITRHLEDR